MDIMMRLMMAAMGRGDEATCRQVAIELQAYLDGYTGAELSRRIGRHLEACRRCGLEARVYTEIKAALSRQGTGSDSASHGSGVDPAALQRLRTFGRTLAAAGPFDTSSE